MMHTLVGREGFRRGMDLYFQRHDGQAVTCDDFAQAIADANPGSGLATRLAAFKRWYSQAGTPRLAARGAYDAAAQRYTLTLHQRAEPATGQQAGQPFVLPVLAALLGADGTVLAPERLLVLDAPEQSFVFEGVAAAPVPSLLRGFSAPVRLDDGLSDAERLVLLAHDTDPFNRWEAAQQLMVDRLLAAVTHGHDPVLDDALAQGLAAVLGHPSLDPAFKALVLTPPSEIYLAEQLASNDPPRIHAVREHWRAQLAARLHNSWQAAWASHQVAEGYAPTHAQAGRRALANLALAMLTLHAVRTGDAVQQGRTYQRFKDATNMTDRVGALQALVHAHSLLADAALQRFQVLAQGDAQVLDKWFTLQALAPEPVPGVHESTPGTVVPGSVFARVKALLQHRHFTLKNPNRARSLMGIFAANPAAVHRADAAGVVLWAEKILELDALNPQLAARVARSMERWARLAEPYRSAAREAVSRVAARPDLSDDLREVVTRALEQPA
jgi:aminopeptidase N